MSYPPDRGRRRKLCRGRAPAVALLALLLCGGAYAYWRDTRFPSRAIALRGTPVELRVQEGVGARELRAVGRGIRLTDRFMRRDLGRSVRRPVEARIARDSRCRPFESVSDGVVGEANDGFLCIRTEDAHWKWMVETDFAAASAVAGHEYVHVLQAELGCLTDGRVERLRWLIEGMADEISWRALIAAGRASDAGVERQIRRDGVTVAGLGDQGLAPLAAYEHADGSDREYALWHLAVRRLLHEAVAAGAAPSRRPEVALRRFCERVGDGLYWRSAFGRSFGLSVVEFYDRFEAFRRRIADRS